MEYQVVTTQKILKSTCLGETFVLQLIAIKLQLYLVPSGNNTQKKLPTMTNKSLFCNYLKTKHLLCPSVVENHSIDFPR